MYSLSQKNFEYLGSSQRLISLPGLLFVLLVHAGIFYFLWNQRLIQNPERVVTLFAELITAPVANPDKPSKIAPEPEPVKLQPAKKPVVKPKQERLVAKASSEPKQKAVESLPESAPQSPSEPMKNTSSAAPASQLPAGPVTLSTELSVSCPKLTPPAYPAISRRMGEEGKLVLRVELDERGRIDDAKVINSSGYERLDAAALTAVKGWQCNPSLRNGQPVRAVALQPFNFVLQGN